MEWVEFEGKARKAAKGWLLNPLIDNSVMIELESDDVLLVGEKVFVRVGARATRIRIPDDSRINKAPSKESEPKCGGRSRCVGGVEFCCTNDVAGGCNGYWNLCGSGDAGGTGGKSGSSKIKFGSATTTFATPRPIKA